MLTETMGGASIAIRWMKAKSNARWPPSQMEDVHVPKVCGHSAQSQNGAGKIDCGCKAGIGLVVARRDTAEFLDLGDEVLHQVAPFIHLAIIVDRHLAVAPRRDHWLCPPLV